MWYLYLCHWFILPWNSFQGKYRLHNANHVGLLDEFGLWTDQRGVCPCETKSHKVCISNREKGRLSLFLVLHATTSYFWITQQPYSYFLFTYKPWKRQAPRQLNDGALCVHLKATITASLSRWLFPQLNYGWYKYRCRQRCVNFHVPFLRPKGAVRVFWVPMPPIAQT